MIKGIRPKNKTRKRKNQCESYLLNPISKNAMRCSNEATYKCKLSGLNVCADCARKIGKRFPDDIHGFTRIPTQPTHNA